jgi:hypothetical protein
MKSTDFTAWSEFCDAANDVIHDGGLVLVVEKRYDFHGCTGFGYEPKPRDYNLDTTLFLGVVPQQRQDDFCLLKEKGALVTVGTERHAYWRPGTDNVFFKDGPIKALFFAATPQDKIYPRDTNRAWLQKDGEKMMERFQKKDKEITSLPYDLLRFTICYPDYACEVIVGRDDVEKYIFDEFRFSFFNGPITYLHVLRAFGMECKLSPDMEEQAQRARISVLQGLMKKQDDYDMVRLLRDALALRMDERPWVLEDETIPGRSLNVPIYVKHLLGKHKNLFKI